MNQIDSSLGKPTKPMTYTPYENRRSLFQADLHLKKSNELTKVQLPEIELLF